MTCFVVSIITVDKQPDWAISAGLARRHLAAAAAAAVGCGGCARSSAAPERLEVLQDEQKQQMIIGKGAREYLGTQDDGVASPREETSDRGCLIMRSGVIVPSIVVAPRPCSSWLLGGIHWIVLPWGVLAIGRGYFVHLDFSGFITRALSTVLSHEPARAPAVASWARHAGLPWEALAILRVNKRHSNRS